MKLSSGYVPSPLTERAGAYLEVLSAIALPAIPVNRHLRGLTGVCIRQDDRYKGRYPVGAERDRSLVFNAGTKLDCRLPGKRKYLPAFPVLHSTSLLCIVIADPKMVDTKDVTPPQAPVDISMKDLRLTEPLMGGDLTVRRFMREQATNSESAETINDGYPVRERSEAEETSVASPLMHKPPITSFARLRILKFAGVGVTGVIINTSVLYALSRWAGLPLVAASAVAVELAAISNYLLNDTWTFAVRSPCLRGFVKFNTAALGGLVLNVLIVWLLARLGLYFLVADLIGIAAAFTVNYAFSVRWVWARAA